MTPDPISLAVWDVSSPVVSGGRFTLKVGIACARGCNLAGATIDVYGHVRLQSDLSAEFDTASRVGGGIVGSVPLEGTAALYWTELDLEAPAGDGDYSWTLHARMQDDVHPPALSDVRFVVVKPPEHRVTITVIDKASRAPLDAVELRLGAFRARTDDTGVAQVEVSGATYDVSAWKLGHEALSTCVSVDRDLNVQLEMAAAAEPELPYWM